MSRANELSMSRAIAEAVQGEADRITEEEVRKAVAAFEAEVRKRIASLAVNVANFYSVERDGRDLVVRVQIDDRRAGQ